jgi:molecular chaperone DnaK
MVADNKSLGFLELHGLPPVPRGVPAIEVSFEIDSNGILHVHARDKGTGKAQSMRIISDSGLSEADIERMVNEADAFRDQDQARKDAAEAKNKLDGLVYTTRRSLEEYGNTLSASGISQVRAALNAAEQAIEDGSLSAIQQAHEGLLGAGQVLAEAIYAAVAADPGAAALGIGSDVVDDEG